jgi:hypothetical protein
MKNFDAEKVVSLSSISDPIEKAKARLAKAKIELSRIERSRSAVRKKVRDTAIFTIGGAFITFHESDDPDDRRIAEVIWDQLKMADTRLLDDDRRREALQVVFGLMVPRGPKVPASTSIKPEESGLELSAGKVCPPEMGK